MDSAQKTEYTRALLSLIPESGTSIGNFTLREQLRKRIESNGGELSDQDYWQLRDSLIDDGLIVQGRGRGGSVHRVLAKAEEEPPPLIQPPVPIVERNLYPPFQATITSGYVKDNRIKPVRFGNHCVTRTSQYRGQMDAPGSDPDCRKYNGPQNLDHAIS